MGKEAQMGMAMGAEEMEMGKTGEDSLRCLIRMLLSFLPRGTPLHQTRIRIILSRRQFSPGCAVLAIACGACPVRTISELG
jgi:hypothetical protein